MTTKKTAKKTSKKTTKKAASAEFHVGDQEQPLRLSFHTLKELMAWRYAENPKDHDIPAMKQSIARFGFRGAIQFDETTSQIEAGHGRLLAVYEMHAEGKARPAGILEDESGAWMMPVLRGTGFQSADEFAAYVIADNYLTTLGGWKDDLLRTIFADFKERHVSFDGIGFTPRHVDRILRDLNPEKKETGKRPDDKLDSFLNATIKQVKVYLAEEDYDPFLDMLEELSRAWGLESTGGHSAVVIRAVQEAYVALSAQESDE